MTATFHDNWVMPGNTMTLPARFMPHISRGESAGQLANRYRLPADADSPASASSIWLGETAPTWMEEIVPSELMK